MKTDPPKSFRHIGRSLRFNRADIANQARGVLEEAGWICLELESVLGRIVRGELNRTEAAILQRTKELIKVLGRMPTRGEIAHRMGGRWDRQGLELYEREVFKGRIALTVQRLGQAGYLGDVWKNRKTELKRQRANRRRTYLRALKLHKEGKGLSEIARLIRRSPGRTSEIIRAMRADSSYGLTRKSIPPENDEISLGSPDP